MDKPPIGGFTGPKLCDKMGCDNKATHPFTVDDGRYESWSCDECHNERDQLKAATLTDNELCCLCGQLSSDGDLGLARAVFEGMERRGLTIQTGKGVFEALVAEAISNKPRQ